MLPSRFRQASGRRRPAARPQLVHLEDRTVPANFFVDPTFATQLDPANLTFNNGQAGPGQAEAGAAPVVLNTTGFTTLRKAIEVANATPGKDTIFLASGNIDVNPLTGSFEPPPNGGVTTGTIKITDALTVAGQGAGSTTVRVTDDTDAAAGTAGAVLVTQGPAVDYSGFTLDGRGAEANPTNPGFTFSVGSGLRYEGASGTIDGVTVRNVIDTTTGTNLGFGVVVIAADSGTPASVVFQNGSLIGNGKTGITFYGVGTTGAVKNSTITGSGTGITQGVSVVEGAVNVLITGNTITGHTGTTGPLNAGGVTSAGVAVGDNFGDNNGNVPAGGPAGAQPSSAVVVGNTFTGNATAIGVGAGVGVDDGKGGKFNDASTAVIQHNNIAGQAVNGVSTGTTQTVNALFNFWGSAAGPLAVGNQTAAGNNPGGLPGSQVDIKALYRDPGVTPNQGMLTAPTPVMVAASPEAYRAALAKATATAVVAPGVPTGTLPVTFAVTFSAPVFGLTPANFTVTGPGGQTISSITPADATNTKYNVRVSGLTGSGAVTLSVLASPVVAVPTSVGAENLFAGRTDLFAGIAAGGSASAQFNAAAAGTVFYVDPAFANQADPNNLTFNGGLAGPGQGVSPNIALNVNGFVTLRDAIDAANATPGKQTIFLASGNIDVNPLTATGGGTIKITDALTVAGQGAGSTTVRVTDDTDAAAGTAGAVLVTQGPAVDYSGFTLDGRGAEANPTNPGFTFSVGSGLRYEGASGTIDGVTVRNVIDTTTGTNLGFGVVVIAADNGTPANVVFQNGSLIGNGKTGITFYGVGTTGAVKNSTVTGPGSALGANALTHGISVVEGAVNVLITGNTITGHTGTTGPVNAGGTTSAGVAVGDNFGDNNGNVPAGGANDAQPASAVIVGNTFTGNATAVGVGSGVNVDNGKGGKFNDASTAVIQHNNVAGQAVNGVSTGTTQTVNALFNFWGSAAGPLAVGNQTAAGDNPGGVVTSQVDIKALYRDPGVTPNQGMLTAPTPVMVAASPEAYRAALAKATATVTAPTSPTNGSPATFAVTFSAPVFGLTAANFAVTGPGTPAVTGITPTDATNTKFNVQVSGLTGSGAVTLSVLASPVVAVPTSVGAENLFAGRTDLFAGIAAGGSASAQFDAVAPTATVTSGLGTLPVTASTVANSTVPLLVTFTEPVTGFDKTDVTLGGTAGAAVLAVNPTGTANVFEVLVGNFTGAGTVTVSIPAGAATDAAGNPSAAVGPVTVTNVDVVAPTATVTAPVPPVTQDATAGPLTVTIQFSETVTGSLVPSEVLVVGNAGGTVTGVTTTDNKTFTVTLNNFDATGGTVSVAVTAGAVTDAAGNPNAFLAPVQVAKINDTTGKGTDTVPPTATVTGPAVTVGNPVTFTVTFNEAVTGFDKTDITVGGAAGAGTVTGVTTTDNKTFTVTLNGFTKGGPVTVSIAAGAATDAAGNPNPAVTNVQVTCFTPAGPRGFAAGGGAGSPAQPVFTETSSFQATNIGTPFGADFTGGNRVATADFNGDGILDTVVGTGPGRATQVRVISGADNKTDLFTIAPFESSFTGGVFVAAGDVTGDGTPDLVISPDQGGGPRVRIFNGKGFGQLADFFGIEDPNFRGGVRTAVGDINCDGVGDLVVAAGFGGGPRLAVFDGRSVTTNNRLKLVGDFFVFEDSLRNGAFVSVGDLDGDGFGDIFAGGGPGGGPRIRVLCGKDLLGGNTGHAIADFFAGDTNNRGGVTLAAKDLDGDTFVDLVTGQGSGGSKVTVYFGKDLRAAPGSPAVGRTLDLFGGFTGGVFVG